jgi:hypothetical protein
MDSRNVFYLFFKGGVATKCIGPMVEYYEIWPYRWSPIYDVTIWALSLLKILKAIGCIVNSLLMWANTQNA